MTSTPPPPAQPLPAVPPRSSARGPLRLLPRGLAPRLILGTVGIVAAGNLLSTWFVAAMLRDHFLQEKALSADRLSRSITTATRHLMRADHKDDAYALMRTIGEAQGVGGIRIYSRTGTVAFRTDAGTECHVGLDAPVCQVCHVEEPPRNGPDPWQRARFFRTEGGRQQMAMVTPIANEPGCSTSACHAHDASTRVLGVLDLTMDLGDLEQELAALRTPAFLLSALGALVVALFLSLVITRLVARPLRRLVQGTRAVAAQEPGPRIEVGTTTELAELAASFNAMQGRLQVAREENARTLGTLEQRVEARSRELQATREQLVESDRLAALGKLSASVAHEVNNPLSAVLNLSVFLQRILTDDGVPRERLPAFRRHLQQISEETARAGRIVTDLLAFSRHGTPHRTPADLNRVVQKTVELVGHRVALSHILLDIDLEPGLPPVPCDPAQIEQILLNLVINAAEALKAKGRIAIRTRRDAAADQAVVEVEDDGPGIPPAILRRVFEPFFTTKTEGKGVGLGLSVAYGIAEAHGGRLSVESDPGRRTVFTLRLPWHPRGPLPEVSP